MDFANTPSFFRSGPKPGTRLFLCVLAAIALLVGDSRYGLMEQVHDGMSLLLYPLQRVVNMPLGIVQHFGDYFTAQADLKSENEQLRTRQLEMSARLARLETLERELNELRILNAIKTTRNDAAQLAETLYTGRDPFSYKIIIDKGADAKLQPGEPVVDSHGLLGQVTRVQPLTAEVSLIIDKNQMVPVMIARTGVRAILYGYGGGVEIRYLPLHADVREGDSIVTSGIDGLYQEGTPVARVSKVERNAGAAFSRVITEPVAGVEQARFVLVLQPKGQTPPRPAEVVVPVKKTKGKQPADSE